jgi:hypothetical protein
VRNFLDNWLPPAVRDSRWLMAPLLRAALGREWRTFAECKARGFALDAYARVREEVQVQVERVPVGPFTGNDDDHPLSRHPPQLDQRLVDSLDVFEGMGADDWSWQAITGNLRNALLEDLGDWFYVEPQSGSATG